MEIYWELVLALVAVVLVGVLFFLHYIGYFYKVKVSAGRSIISEVKVAYKFRKGDYDNCDPYLSEIVKLYPDMRSLGIFYDNLAVKDPNECRYIIGLIIAEGEGKNGEKSVVENLQKHGFKFITLPKVENSVKARHPFTITLSHYFAGWKAYPAMGNYIKEQKLNAHPFIEIYFDKTIHYMVPLSNHKDFYVEEVKDMLEK